MTIELLKEKEVIYEAWLAGFLLELIEIDKGSTHLFTR